MYKSTRNLNSTSSITVLIDTHTHTHTDARTHTHTCTHTKEQKSAASQDGAHHTLCHVSLLHRAQSPGRRGYVRVVDARQQHVHGGLAAIVEAARGVLAHGPDADATGRRVVCCLQRQVPGVPLQRRLQLLLLWLSIVGGVLAKADAGAEGGGGMHGHALQHLPILVLNVSVDPCASVAPDPCTASQLVTSRISS